MPDGHCGRLVGFLCGRASLSRVNVLRMADGRAGSDFGVEIEESVEAALELRFYFCPRALDRVHGHVGLVAVRQFQRRILDFSNFALGQEPQSVD